MDDKNLNIQEQAEKDGAVLNDEQLDEVAGGFVNVSDKTRRPQVAYNLNNGRVHSSLNEA